MRNFLLVIALSVAGCGAPAGDLVVVEFSLARNTALTEIKELKIDLFTTTSPCSTLVRTGAAEGLEPIASSLVSLTPEERRAGADRYVESLPVGTWNLRMEAFGEDDSRVGVHCDSEIVLNDGAVLIVQYIAHENRR